MSKKSPIGVVYSTDPNFQYQYADDAEPLATLSPSKQKLRVSIQRHGRGGKTVTLISGFVGTNDDLQELARTLKNRCGVGGSAKEGEIIIQGELKEKVLQTLSALGYSAK